MGTLKSSHTRKWKGKEQACAHHKGASRCSGPGSPRLPGGPGSRRSRTVRLRHGQASSSQSFSELKILRDAPHPRRGAQIPPLTWDDQRPLLLAPVYPCAVLTVISRGPSDSSFPVLGRGKSHLEPKNCWARTASEFTNCGSKSRGPWSPSCCFISQSSLLG